MTEASLLLVLVGIAQFSGPIDRGSLTPPSAAAAGVGPGESGHEIRLIVFCTPALKTNLFELLEGVPRRTRGQWVLDVLLVGLILGNVRWLVRSRHNAWLHAITP